MLSFSDARHIGKYLACLGLAAVCAFAQNSPAASSAASSSSSSSSAPTSSSSSSTSTKAVTSSSSNTATTTTATTNAAAAAVASDPGLRGGAAGAGGTFTTIDNTSSTANTADQFLFQESRLVFQEVVSVTNSIATGLVPNVNGGGLGPAFNLNQCSGCHSQPAVGGSSPASNPQFTAVDGGGSFANLDGATNAQDLSKFVTANGPIREVRFIVNAAGNALDGGVHDVFTIAGRTDAPGCNLAQTNFDTQFANHNAIFRIPTPVFGGGLVEMVADSALNDNLNNTSSQRSALGIAGSFNTNGNDGTITRFGWKAQNKSLLLFAGEAYNVEMGVTNNIFQSDRFPSGTPDSVVANCTFNTSPEDFLNTINPQTDIPETPFSFTTTTQNGISLSEPVLTTNPNAGTTVGTASEMSSDIVNFATFMQLLAPPTAVTAAFTTTTGTSITAAQISAGSSLFSSTGCVLCHSASLTTNISNQGTQASGSAQNTLFQGLAGVTFAPFSDFAIHHMGSTLADGVTQGQAGPDQFRSAPLWGVGQRIFFLHDGRTSSLLTAIEDHFSPNTNCVDISTDESFVYDPIVNPELIQLTAISQSQFCGSEANEVVGNFNALNATQQQEILDFLRSL